MNDALTHALAIIATTGWPRPRVRQTLLDRHVGSMRGAVMIVGSLFSGIGGLELGLEWAGFGPVKWQVEHDEWCRSVLKRHWPDTERHADVRDVGAHNLARVELICGGFPCQDVSGAGKGAGLDGARSGLWWEFARIVGELRPTWAVVENVASGGKRWVDAVRGSLGQLGYKTLPIPIAAESVGAPHRRARIFLVARRISDPIGEPKRQQQQRPAAGRPPYRIRNEGASQLGDVGEPVANRNGSDGQYQNGEPGQRRERTRRAIVGGKRRAVGDGDGPKTLRGSRILNKKRQTFGHNADGSSGPWPWPPAPGDIDGWRDYLDAGGPQPGICRSADGLPCGMARAEWSSRLTALGNAVVPQCAHVVGEVIRLLEFGAV